MNKTLRYTIKNQLLNKTSTSVSQNRQTATRHHSAIARGSAIVMQRNIQVTSMVLARDDMGSLILQQLHHLMNNPVALRMPSIINTPLLHRLTLVLHNLRRTPRIRIRPGRLDITDILNGSLFLRAHRRLRLSSRHGLFGIGLLVLLCRNVLLVEGTIAVANQIHPDLAVSDELAGLALADFDAISNLFAD